MSEFKFAGLQLFDDGPAIPPELEGVAPDIARAVLKEAGLGASKEDKPATPEGNAPAAAPQEGKKDEPLAQNQGQTGDDNKPAGTAQKTGEPGADNNQDGAEPPGPVPYRRFKEVNERAKLTAAELDRLKAELDALKARASAPTPPPTAQAPETDGISPQIIQQVRDVAFAKTLKRLNMTQDDFNKLAYDEDPMAQLNFQTAYNLELNSLITEANNIAERQRRAYEQRQMAQRTVASEYAAFAADLQNQPDFQEFSKFSIEKLNSLTPVEQQALNESADRLQNGQGSLQDLLLVKNYVAAAQKEFRAKQQPPKQQTPPPTAPPTAAKPNPAQVAQEKLKQMAAHPKASQVRGSNSQGGLTTADLERMMQEKNWEEIPQEIRDILMGLKAPQ